MSAAVLPKLFTPIKIRGVEFKNRIGISPMCQYVADDGFFNEKHLVHLGARAMGGAGFIIIEATAVEPEGRITPRDIGLWKDEQIPFLRKIAQYLKEQGCVSAIQLAHAGRKASAARPWEGDHHLKTEEGGWETKAPSPIVFDEKQLWKKPHELTVSQIHQVQDKFAAAAKRAIAAGIEVIEIHGAHGYLIDEFYSPLGNKRTDQYGGSFENRIRFITEVVQKVRAAIPDTTPLFVRLSTTDWHPEGWTIDDSVKLARVLKANGVDLVDSSSGFIVPNFKDIPFGPNFQVPLAEKIRKEAGILTAAVGFINQPQQAEDIIREGKADFALIGRESLRDPNWPYRAAVALGVDTKILTVPPQYAYWVKARY